MKSVEFMGIGTVVEVENTGEWYVKVAQGRWANVPGGITHTITTEHLRLLTDHATVIAQPPTQTPVRLREEQDYDRYAIHPAGNWSSPARRQDDNVG